VFSEGRFKIFPAKSLHGFALHKIYLSVLGVRAGRLVNLSKNFKNVPKLRWYSVNLRLSSQKADLRHTTLKIWRRKHIFGAKRFRLVAIGHTGGVAMVTVWCVTLV